MVMTPPSRMIPPREAFQDPEAEDVLFDKQVEAHEAAARHETDQYYEDEAYRLNKGGYSVSADELRELDATKPHMMDLVTERRVLGSEGLQGWANENPNAFGDDQKEWGQTYIGRDDRAVWSKLYPKKRQADDGTWYQDPQVKVQRSSIPEKLRQGFSRQPQAPMRPRPALPCGFRSLDGGPCPFRGDTNLDVRNHEGARHPQAYAVRQSQATATREEAQTAALLAIAQNGRQAAGVHGAPGQVPTTPGEPVFMNGGALFTPEQLAQIATYMQAGGDEAEEAPSKPRRKAPRLTEGPEGED